MITEEIDEQQATPSVATGSDTVQSQEALEDSSASSNGAPAGDTPPAETELDRFKADVVRATGSDKPAAAEAKEEATTETDEPAVVEPKAEEAEALSQATPVNIAQTPEWKRFVAIADKASPEDGKAMRKYMRETYEATTRLKHDFERAQPDVQIARELRQSVGGDEQGLTNVRLLVKNFDTNPTAAVPMLETLLQDARKRAGLVLQSPELLTEAQQLDQQVERGEIDTAQATKRKAELLQLEQAKMVVGQTKQQQEAAAQKAQQEQAQLESARVTEQLNTLESNWVANKQKNDPDFAAVADLYSVFTKHNAGEFADKNQRMPTVAEATQLLEKSLKDAKAEAAKFRPKAKARTPLNGGSNGSSGNNRQQPANDYEAFKQTVDEAIARNS